MNLSLGSEAGNRLFHALVTKAAAMGEISVVAGVKCLRYFCRAKTYKKSRNLTADAAYLKVRVPGIFKTFSVLSGNVRFVCGLFFHQL
jgi:hypothetical protein